MSAAPNDFSLIPSSFEEMQGWSEDDPTALFAAMRACHDYIRQRKPYRSGALGLSSDELEPLLIAAKDTNPKDAFSARRFFEKHCRTFRISKKDGSRGFVTGFYEPEIEVSDLPDAVWRYPFYRRPEDLIDIDEANRPGDMGLSCSFAHRDTMGKITPYADRKAIDEGCLAGRGLEIAWAKSRIDVFFAHVQGAARLVYPDGSVKRITYAAKSGHGFSAIGKLLIDRGEIARDDISMQSIRAWLDAHQDRMDEVLWHNRSYIFFREAPVGDPQAGPVAAAKVPLVAGRSLAVDRFIHTFGFPFFVRAESLRHLDGGKPFARTMLALDTGSAIVGPARGDIFTGSGYEAGQQAGTIKEPADFYILIPHAAARRFAG